jgi:hypothetical protein
MRGRPAPTTTVGGVHHDDVLACVARVDCSEVGQPMYAVSGWPHVSGTSFPSTSRLMIIGHDGTGAPSLSGSTLPWVGQWYSILTPTSLLAATAH